MDLFYDWVGWNSMKAASPSGETASCSAGTGSTAGATPAFAGSAASAVFAHARLTGAFRVGGVFLSACSVLALF